MKKILVLTVAPLIIVAAAVGVFLFARSSPQPITAAGVVTITDVQDRNCAAIYSGIQAGVDVTVMDQTGQIAALGHLGSPKLSVGPMPIAATICSYPFEVHGVPRGRGFYKMTIGTHPAGTYSEADIQQPLTLGLQ